jgi:hypothetical protein
MFQEHDPDPKGERNVRSGFPKRWCSNGNLDAALR